jgi:hypothetical protein
MDINDRIRDIVNEGFRHDGWSSRGKIQFMVELIIQRKPKTLMEVGIYGGRSFFPMYWASKEYPGATLHGCDPYAREASAVGMENENLSWWNQVDYEMLYKIFSAELLKLNPLPVFYRTTGRNVNLENVDYLHIDGNHSEEESLADVKYWMPRMTPKAVIVFDDCDWPSTRRAVDFLDRHCKLLYSMKTTNVANFYEVA